MSETISTVVDPSTDSTGAAAGGESFIQFRTPEPGTTDSPEIAAYKAEVKRVAEKYAKEYNLCSVMQKALAEVGITSKSTTVPVKVTTTHPFEFDLRVEPSEYRSKSADEQKEALAALITKSLASAGAGFRLTIPASALVSAVETEVTYEGVDGDRTWAYTSSSGRVTHGYRTVDLNGVDRWIYGACGKEANRTEVALTSARSEHRRCEACERALGNV